MADKLQLDRRDFLRHAAGAIGAAAHTAPWTASTAEAALRDEKEASPATAQVGYPRRFEGRALRMISFPLGGVAAGSIGLGGRGQLINWEIFNRPNKGYRPSYCFPSIWAQAGSDKPVARVLESRILPPYEGQDGLGSANAPGLTRLDSAAFFGEYPLARIEFEDRSLPVKVALDAFSPFIPHDPDDSGLPVAVLRYRVTNPGHTEAKVGIAFSIDNPVTTDEKNEKHRLNEFRAEGNLAGLVMTNPGVDAADPMSGEFVIAAAVDAGAQISHWLGWPASRWWNSPLLFWDQFAASGSLGAQPDPHNQVGVLCLQRSIPPGESASFQFLLGWRFPNRTPDWCGWDAPHGEEHANIGNWYATHFKSAWEAAAYAAANLDSLEARTRMFAAALRNSTIPAEVKEAASANLSTLATTTCFRTADGEFHGFEGSDDTRGCCFGNCAHVWNYETVTPFLFPSFARSLRRSAFGYSMDDDGAIHFRQTLPDGKSRWGYAAADGQMGQIVHAWLDWKISGDDALLRSTWPRVKKALEFAWVPGGWDANRDGVMEGVQHNTYDVEFYGPNPMCGIYYLGALRAGEELARAAGDESSAQVYRDLFDKGRQWIDSNLFNGEYYIQKVRGFRKDEIAKSIRGDMGADDTTKPEYQVGEGCLVDQLVGQYLVDAGGLGALVSPDHIRATLQSIHRYNVKPTLDHHENVARTFALNDESAVIVCDYARAQRPRIPFPYFSEVFTGLEYTVSALMMCWGMVDEGVAIARNTRLRFDGEKRNPWDEAECGHHYARAMSAWSNIRALSGFLYDGLSASVIAVPPTSGKTFQCFWASGTGWGEFSLRKELARTVFQIKVLSGVLACRSFEIAASGTNAIVRRGAETIANQITRRDDRTVVALSETVRLAPKDEIEIEVHA